MTRCDWDRLPAEVHDAVTAAVGAVERTEPAPAGSASDLAGTLHLADGGAVFCKGLRADSPRAWMHRTEARATTILNGAGPRLLASIDAGGWLLLVLEHVDGRHPVLAPGSPDLLALAGALGDLQRQLTPCPLDPVQMLARRWARPSWPNLITDPPTSLNSWERQHLHRLAELEAAAPSLIDGDTLVHTDPVPENFLIDHAGRVRLVDWAFPARAAGWVDTALLVPRLIDAGHTPLQAEAWAAAVPAWATADPTAITAFAAALSGLWTSFASAAPDPRQEELAAVARRWAWLRIALGT